MQHGGYCLVLQCTGLMSHVLRICLASVQSRVCDEADKLGKLLVHQTSELAKADKVSCFHTGVVKERRAVQYGVVDASDVDVAAGAPGFSAVFQSKEDLRGKLMECSDVPKDARLYFWNGKLWIRWGNSQDLPGPDRDPLRIKVVRQQSAGTLLPCNA